MTLATSFKGVVVLVLLLTLQSMGISQHGGEVQAADDSRADHPFSDPMWSPLRETAIISCATTNCDVDGPYHDYPALDLVGDFGDPIYAAGAGIFHVGGIAPECVSGPPTRGTWVWVDHGPAGSTRYHHLDNVWAVEGQYVTPETQIGTMGNSGDALPCEVAYLHIELRDSEQSVIKRTLPNFLACESGTTVRIPEDLGFSNWDDVPPRAYSTPTTDNSCIPDSWTHTPERPVSVVLSPGVGSMTVHLPDAPVGADDVRVRLQLFHPSAGEFGVLHELSANTSDSSVTFDDLLANRLYRAFVSNHNSAGWSAWSVPVEAETGFFPHTPEYRESFATKTTISYKWYRGDNHDADYRVAIRRSDGLAWSEWTYVDVPSTELSYRFRDLYAGAFYQVTVSAWNQFGSSRFAPPTTISTVCYTVCNPPPIYIGLQPAVRLSYPSQ